MSKTQHTLRTFDAPAIDDRQVYEFETSELTALCPFDFGGPDHYDLLIRYEPDTHALESKSFKEFLQGFRDREISAEHLAAEIHSLLRNDVKPKRLYLRLAQARRGGIEESIELGDNDLSR